MRANCCKELDRFVADGEVAIVYSEQHSCYGIKYLDGGSSFQLIRYCPWCGSCIKRKQQEIPASELNQGDFFRKPRGEYVYIRISDSAARFNGMDMSKIHGVCHNGNMCSVDKMRRVVRMERKDFLCL